MFTTNPFAALSATVPPVAMRAYVVAMIVLVVAGTLFDIVHKGSARYFFDNWRRSRTRARSPLGGGELVWMAIDASSPPWWTSSRPANSATRAGASRTC